MKKYKPILFVILFSFVLGSILGSIYHVTKTQIEINEHFELQKCLLYAINITTEDMTKEEVYITFHNHLMEERLRGITYYSYWQEDQLIGYCFPFSGQGLWGQVTGYIAVDVTGVEVLGIVFTENEETPGLGARIDDLWFKEQFRGLDIQKSSDYVSFDISDESGLATISGATLTVNSIKDTLNQTIDELKEILKEDFNESSD